jgi:hypothetical protein
MATTHLLCSQTSDGGLLPKIFPLPAIDALSHPNGRDDRPRYFLASGWKRHREV